jgi:hypothetical protein
MPDLEIIEKRLAIFLKVTGGEYIWPWTWGILMAPALGNYYGPKSV